MSVPQAEATVYLQQGEERIRIRPNSALPLLGGTLNFVKVEPPIAGLEYISFRSFLLRENAIDLKGYTQNFDLEPGQSYTLTPVDPIPVPMPSNWIEDIDLDVDIFCAHVFRRFQGQITFVSSFIESWIRGPNSLVRILESRGLQFSSILIGTDTVNMMPSNEFFADRTNGKALMNLYVELQNQMTIVWGSDEFMTDSLPLELKVLAHLAMDQLRSPDRSNLRRKDSLRRFVCSLLSGAVSVNLVDELSLRLPNGQVLTSACFDRLQFNWNDAASFAFNWTHFLMAQTGLNHLFAKPNRITNEHTLAGLVWTCALNAAFLLENSSPSFNYVMEWYTNNILFGVQNRKVDYTVLLDCLPPGPDQVMRPYPILLVEYGAKTVERDNKHKDYDKMTTMLSMACYRLIQKLLELNRDPKLARAYGLLIGGTSARLMIAYPVFKQVGQVVKIGVNISCDPAWQIDLLDSEQEMLMDFASFPHASVISPDQPVDWSSVDLSDTLRDGGSINLQQSLPAPSEETRLPILRAAPRFKFKSFAQLSFLGKEVQIRLNLICAETKHDTSCYRIAYVPEKVRVPGDSKRKQESKQNVPKEKSTSVESKHSQQKPFVATECKILRTVNAYFPPFFARLYDVELLEHGKKAIYTMEKLEPLISHEGQRHSLIWDCESADECFYNCSRILLDCLHGLHLLHDRLNIVHSDISFYNIMYSTIDRIWKLIDFEQSMIVEESAITGRYSGTESLIAPECLSSGCFTPAGDIWSLGRVLSRLLPLSFYYELSREYIAAHEELLALLYTMTLYEPDKRPSAVEAMNRAYNIVTAFEEFIDLNDPVILSVSNVIELIKFEQKQKREKEMVESEKEGPKEQEEQEKQEMPKEEEQEKEMQELPKEQEQEEKELQKGKEKIN